MKEGVVMAEALGQELLIDLYSCDEDAISSATAVQESVATAFDLAELDVDEISCQVMDEEIALLSVAPGFHFTLHTYPALGYVAVDLYSFEQTLPLTLIMKALRKSFRPLFLANVLITLALCFFNLPPVCLSWIRVRETRPSVVIFVLRRGFMSRSLPKSPRCTLVAFTFSALKDLRNAFIINVSGKDCSKEYKSTAT